MEVFNKQNNKYYSSNTSGAFTENGVADILVSNVPLQKAILSFIEQKTEAQKIKLFEIASGKRLNRWEIIHQELASQTHKAWDVTLSDFTSVALPSQNLLAKLDCSFLKIKNAPTPVDISKELPKPEWLDSESKFNAVLTSYGFDSVWAKEDARYEKIGKAVFKNFELTDLSKQEYGDYIQAFLDATHQEENTAINFAGGMLARINELFENYIEPNGFFISIDITEPINDHLFSAGAAFKLENYKVLVPILEDKGYKVELYSLNAFIEMMGQSTPINLEDHSVLFVTK